MRCKWVGENSDKLRTLEWRNLAQKICLADDHKMIFLSNQQLLYSNDLKYPIFITLKQNILYSPCFPSWSSDLQSCSLDVLFAVETTRKHHVWHYGVMWIPHILHLDILKVFLIIITSVFCQIHLLNMYSYFKMMFHPAVTWLIRSVWFTLRFKKKKWDIRRPPIAHTAVLARAGEHQHSCPCCPWRCRAEKNGPHSQSLAPALTEIDTKKDDNSFLTRAVSFVCPTEGHYELGKNTESDALVPHQWDPLCLDCSEVCMQLVFGCTLSLWR